jgi:hypothetical protein
MVLGGRVPQTGVHKYELHPGRGGGGTGRPLTSHNNNATEELKDLYEIYRWCYRIMGQTIGTGVTVSLPAQLFGQRAALRHRAQHRPAAPASVHRPSGQSIVNLE